MNDFLQAVSILLAALFWGGLIAVTLTPFAVRFTQSASEREASAAYLTKQTRFFGWAQIVLSGLLFLTALAGGAGVETLLPAAFLVALSAANAGIFTLQYRIDDPRQTSEEREQAERASRQLYLAFIATDVFEIILGAIVIVTLIFA